MIEVRDLVVKYGGITALQGISLNIPEGKIVSMVGANGAGKSTTINAISGMVKKVSGNVTFKGVDLNMPPQDIVKRGVVQVPEGRKIFSAISVTENIILGGFLIKDKAKIENGLERVYKLFPILEKRKKKSGSLPLPLRRRARFWHISPKARLSTGQKVQALSFLVHYLSCRGDNQDQCRR